jgi:hypothetical protein
VPAETPEAGKSAVSSERNVGTAFAPDAGPANTRFLAWFAQEAVNVPEVDTGEFVTVNVPGMLRPTDVTVPPVIATATQVKFVPSHFRYVSVTVGAAANVVAPEPEL